MIWLAIGTSLLFALMITGIGILFTRRPPSSINFWYGYRTARSMKSQAAWDFAQRYAGHVWIRSGPLMAVVSAVLIALFGQASWFEWFYLVLTFLQLAIMMVVIPMTERELGRRFDRDGNPKA